MTYDDAKKQADDDRIAFRAYLDCLIAEDADRIATPAGTKAEFDLTPLREDASSVDSVTTA